MDTHVHTGAFAGHGDAAIEERMLTIAGEGIELPVSSEHNMRVDFDERSREAGVRDYFTPVMGSEVTTPSLGHFNVFPIPRDGRPIDQRAPDWLRLREVIASAGTDPVIVLNHARDLHGGFRPFGRARHISVAGEDLESWPLPANAMEGIPAPYWPTAKPYQPTSIEFTGSVLGLSGPVFVDGDGSGRFDSAFEYARREVSAANQARPLVTRLGSCDAAVAVQAASLLRAQDQAGFERRIHSMIPVAPPHVAKGLTAYLDGWKESQAGNH